MTTSTGSAAIRQAVRRMPMTAPRKPSSGLSRHTDSYRDRNLKGYLLTIARNVCRDYFKRAARNRNL